MYAQLVGLTLFLGALISEADDLGVSTQEYSVCKSVLVQVSKQKSWSKNGQYVSRSFNFRNYFKPERAELWGLPDVYWIANDTVMRPKDLSYVTQGNIKRLTNDEGDILGPNFEMTLMFVVKQNDALVLGHRHMGPHPTLVGGLNPQVKAAGEVVIKNGRILQVNYRSSGHFMPDEKSLGAAKRAIDEHLSEYFSENFRGYKDPVTPK